MNKDSVLDEDVLPILKFNFNMGFWIHSQEGLFAIKIETTCFYVSFHGCLAKHSYDLTVGELEKQFYERIGRLLY